MAVLGTWGPKERERAGKKKSNKQARSRPYLFWELVSQTGQHPARTALHRTHTHARTRQEMVALEPDGDEGEKTRAGVFTLHIPPPHEREIREAKVLPRIPYMHNVTLPVNWPRRMVDLVLDSVKFSKNRVGLLENWR